MSHISAVQTPVKASGKKQRTTFDLPRVFAELHILDGVALFGFEIEIGSFGTNGKGIR